MQKQGAKTGCRSRVGRAPQTTAYKVYNANCVYARQLRREDSLILYTLFKELSKLRYLCIPLDLSKSTELITSD
jgi:hypothetical protein